MHNFSNSLLQSFQDIPDKEAIFLLHSLELEQVITYKDLWFGSLRYAEALQTAGIRDGEVVILILEHGADLIYAFFGAILSGAIPSIMPFLTEKLLAEQYKASLTALFEITAPAAVITYPEFVNEVQQARSGKSVRCILSSDQIVKSQSSSSDGEPNHNQLIGIQKSSRDIVLLQHSSGTTGLQKGVALSHQAVFNQLESYSKAIKLSTGDVVVSWLPLYHDMGLIAGFIMPILCRIPLVLLSPFDWVRAPYRLLRAISDYKGTLTWLPNFAYNFCAQKIRARDIEGVDLSSWRAVINCSEPMYCESHAMFLQRFQPYGLRSEALATSYAMAENVFAVTQGGISSPVSVDIIDRNDLQKKSLATSVASLPALKDKATSLETPPDNKLIKMLSAGRPIDGTHLRILDAHGSDLPERHIGEIAIHSNCMLTGYYRRPDLNQQSFLDDWYLTGDLGYIAKGELYITGRKKDLIIVGGKNVYPQDLENLASQVSGVHPGRVAAFGVFNQESGTEDVVLIAEVDEEEMSQINRITTEILQYVTQRSDIALRFVFPVERNWLIKTSSGKVARSDNREKYLNQLTSEV